MAAWALIGLGVLLFISRRRPEMLEVMGRAFAESGDEPDMTQEDVMGVRDGRNPDPAD
jgi:hypothetical protein